ncbi:MAG: LPS export ABC transporter permease LptF [Methylococcales bacterium]|nr:LPS export ABC transporter permease LptF [Methylococcales bacterium]
MIYKNAWFSVINVRIAVELTRTLLAVLGVVVTIIVSRRFIRILKKAVEGSIANNVLLKVLALKLLEAAVQLLPVAVFMSVLMVIGRMYRDQEMTALASAGYGLAAIYRALALSVIPVSLLALLLATSVMPWANGELRQLLTDDGQRLSVDAITAGQFNEFDHGQLVMYVASIDEDKNMHQVFIRQQKGAEQGLIRARQGEAEVAHQGLYLRLSHGQRVLRSADSVSAIEHYKDYSVRLEERVTSVAELAASKATDVLWQSTRIEEQAELQRRVSVPMAIILLSLLAAPLAQIAPRSGIYGNLFLAFLIYFTYSNMTRSLHALIVKNQLPLWPGYGWAYFALSLIVMALLARYYNWRYWLTRWREARS